MADTATTWVRHFADKSFHKKYNAQQELINNIRSTPMLTGTVKISKDGEVMWAHCLDQSLSDDYSTGLRSFAYADGVLYAAGKT